MTENPITVLFMDDEPSSEIVQVAVEWMENEGFQVDLAESMSQAVQAYYDKYYDIFVLDIDMSHIPDEEEGDGVNVLKRFISLHNQTKVIMFSGAGTTPHWFAAANAHCYGYVHKNEKGSVRRLVEMIRKGAAEAPQTLARPEGPCPKRVLLHAEAVDEPFVKEAVQRALGRDWEIQRADAVADADRMLRDDRNYGMVLLFRETFEMYPDEKGAMISVLSHTPAPQVIVGCRGEDQRQHSILFIANQQPFRIINTAADQWPAQLEAALKSAETWYGQREIFKADPEALRRMHITLPADVMEEWEYGPEEMEELYSAFAEEGKTVEGEAEKRDGEKGDMGKEAE